MASETTLKTGFYGTDSETIYVTPAGRIWIVASADDIGPDPVELQSSDMPVTALASDHLMTPDEAMDAIGRIEATSGETILIWDDLVAQVEVAAKADAALFVAEFGEAIDPATTDWDTMAWQESGDEIEEMTANDAERLWPIYQAALVAETERLVSESK